MTLFVIWEVLESWQTMASTLELHLSHRLMNMPRPLSSWWLKAHQDLMVRFFSSGFFLSFHRGAILDPVKVSLSTHCHFWIKNIFKEGGKEGGGGVLPVTSRWLKAYTSYTVSLGEKRRKSNVLILWIYKLWDHVNHHVNTVDWVSQIQCTTVGICMYLGQPHLCCSTGIITGNKIIEIYL